MRFHTYNDFVYSVTDGGTHYIIRDVLKYIESSFLKSSPKCSKVLYDVFANNNKYFDYRVSFTKRLSSLENLLMKESLTNDNAINLICSNKTMSDAEGKINGLESLAICCGNTTINSVLLNTEKHFKKLIKQNEPYVEKTILILTDKWDEERFRKKHAVTYINYVFKYNIKIVILLVTDFGIIPMPFTVLCNKSGYNYFESHSVNEIVDDEMIPCNSNGEDTIV